MPLERIPSGTNAPRTKPPGTKASGTKAPFTTKEMYKLIRNTNNKIKTKIENKKGGGGEKVDGQI